MIPDLPEPFACSGCIVDTTFPGWNRVFSRHGRLWLASSGGGREGSDGGDIHRRPLVAGLGAQIGRRGAGPLSKAGCARQQRRRDVRNTAADEGRHRTETWAVNHLAPFLLSKLLLHRLKESAPSAISSGERE